MPPVKQYVNLDPDPMDKTLGTKLELTATANAGKSKGPKQVTWKLEPGQKNCPLKYLAAGDRCKLKDETTSIPQAGGEFKNELTLPHVGLDTYKVKVQKWVRTIAKEIELETWRRIYYSVHYIKDGDLTIFEGCKAKFEQAFAAGGIELLEITGERKKTDVDTEVAECGSKPATYDLKYLYTGGNPPALTKKPFHLRVVVVPDVADLQSGRTSAVLTEADTAEQDPGGWVEDLDAGGRPDPAGKENTVAELNAMDLTQDQVTELGAPPSGAYYTLTSSGTLSKGGVAVATNDLVGWDGAAWFKLGKQPPVKVEILNRQASIKPPTKGELRTVSDGGTISAGSLAVSGNDTVLYDGTKWVKATAKGSYKALNLDKPTARPASGAAYRCKDAGKLTAGNVDVKAGQRVTFDGANWAIDRGRWVIHLRTADRHSQQSTWLDANHALVRADDSGTVTAIKDKIERVDARHLKVKVHEVGVVNDCLDRGKSVTIDIKLATLDDGACGYNFGNICVVRTNEDPGRRDTVILQTLTHEIGHGIQQAKKTLDVHDDAGTKTGTEDNPKWYTDDHGGQGPHCWTNAKEVNSTKTTSGKTYAHDAGKLCTMFHRDDAEVDPDGKFCPTCVEQIKKTDFSKAFMIAKNWNLYG